VDIGVARDSDAADPERTVRRVFVVALGAAPVIDAGGQQYRATLRKDTGVEPDGDAALRPDRGAYLVSTG
jgi:hypothetical protein